MEHPYFTAISRSAKEWDRAAFSKWQDIVRLKKKSGGEIAEKIYVVRSYLCFKNYMSGYIDKGRKNSHLIVIMSGEGGDCRRVKEWGFYSFIHILLFL